MKKLINSFILSKVEGLPLFLKKIKSSIFSRVAFTLIELLIVIGILTVLAAVAIIIINPAQMIKQSRDANRFTELVQIDKALSIYQAFGATSFGAQNTIYLSLPDSDPQCGSYYGQLPATTSPWVYKCAPSTTYRNTDGTGWIPVNFTSVQSSSGPLFVSLPIDPINTATDNLYYTYISGSWALSAAMESEKYIASNAANDGGQVSTRFEIGNDLALNANLVPLAILAIGDSYQGGIIAYILQSGDPGYDANVQHGLIAASSDQSAGAIWGCSAVLIGTTGTALGTGNQNTIDIINGCATAGIAARLAGDLVEGGYSDWFLPSRDELNKLYINRVEIGGFANDIYWSSSEDDVYLAWVQDFYEGYQVGDGKVNAYYVRAIRAF